jgi:hypothetical protein
MEDQTPKSETTTPILVDMGKVKKKDLKALKRGEGVLMENITDIIQEVRDNLGERAEGKVLVPVIITYEKKKKKQSLFGLLG